MFAGSSFVPFKRAFFQEFPKGLQPQAEMEESTVRTARQLDKGFRWGAVHVEGGKAQGDFLNRSCGTLLESWLVV